MFFLFVIFGICALEISASQQPVQTTVLSQNTGTTNTAPHIDRTSYQTVHIAPARKVCIRRLPSISRH